MITLALLAAASSEAAHAGQVYEATPAEVNAAMPGEQFADAIARICPEALSREKGLLGSTGLTPVSGKPDFLQRYPETIWYSLDAAPRNVFISYDAIPNVKRCRVVMANNIMPGFAHLRATVAAQVQGFAMVDSPKVEPRRNYLESVWARPAGAGKTLFMLIQSHPQPENVGQGWQATATVAVMDR